jgi:hypothetical protein
VLERPPTKALHELDGEDLGTSSVAAGDQVQADGCVGVQRTFSDHQPPSAGVDSCAE